MAREFDVIVFGATGFTGRHVVEQMHKSGKEEGLTWAVAGRSESKLNDALKEVATWIKEDHPDENVDVDAFVKCIPKVVADVADPESLQRMAARCMIVINTVGPYRFFGEPVVAACVEEGTHHVDVSGEPQFIESMQLKYHEVAKEKGIYLLSACGFDSIPCELAFNLCRENFRGKLNSVETFLRSKNPKGGSVNTGTWESAVHGVAHWNELVSLRRQIGEKLFPRKMERPRFKLEKRGVVFRTPLVPGYCLPFLGSDRSVVLKSEMFRHQNCEGYQPVQIQTYFSLPSIIAVIGLSIVGSVFLLMSKFAFGRRLLIAYPEIFSLGIFKQNGRTREQSKAASFKTIACGKGWHAGDDESKPPTGEIVCSLEGPDPGYIGTSTMLVQSAICVLKDNVAMPFSGGCLSPGFALEKTTLPRRLSERGFKLTVDRQS